ncbi:hypothetical protein [Hymenobacter saemangeumensis]
MLKRHSHSSLSCRLVDTHGGAEAWLRQIPWPLLRAGPRQLAEANPS